MDPLLESLAEKIVEQVDLTLDLLALLPPGARDWQPAASGRPLWTAAELLPHLVESTAGFLAVLVRLRPEELGYFVRYRDLPLPSGCEGVCERLREYRAGIERGMAMLRDSDLVRRVPTVFVPAGDSVLTLLLGNLEHLINHKHQLFLYLRMMGVEAGTAQLYRLRGL
jgi:hypothetical protein